MKKPWFADLLLPLPVPTMVIDLDAFDRNVDRMVVAVQESGAPNKTLRIATKSLRVPRLIQRALDRSKVLQGLMCFSALEAEQLAKDGGDIRTRDFLIAYPPCQTEDIEAWIRIHQAGHTVRVVLDSVDQMRWVESIVARRPLSRPLEVVLDVDLSLSFGPLWLGVRRSPVRTLEGLGALLGASKAFGTLKVVGLMGYEAQVAGLGDRNPFKPWINPIAKWIRFWSRDRASVFRAKAADLFKAHEIKLEIFNGGGTGSLNWAATEPWLTEVTAGSGLFCSHLFDNYSNIQFEPAAFFSLRVGRASPGYVTCNGGGFIASGEPGWDRVPVPVWPTGLALVANEGCGEVQTPLKVPKGLNIRLGDRVWFRSSKAGEVMERFSHVILVSAKTGAEVVPTYRGSMWTW